MEDTTDAPISLNEGDIVDFIHYAIEHDYPHGSTAEIKDNILQKIESLGYTAPEYERVWNDLLGTAKTLPGEELIEEFNLYPAGTKLIFAGNPNRRSYAEDYRDEELYGTTGAYATVYQIVLKPKNPVFLNYARNIALQTLATLFGTRDGFGHYNDNDEFTNNDGHEKFTPYKPPYSSREFHYTYKGNHPDNYHHDVRKIYPFLDKSLRKLHKDEVKIEGNSLVFKTPLVLEHVHLLFNTIQQFITPSTPMADLFYFASVEEARGPGMEPDGSSFADMEYSNDYADPTDQLGNMENLNPDQLLPAAMLEVKELYSLRESKDDIILPQIADIALRSLSGEWPDASGKFPSLKELAQKRGNAITGKELEQTISQRLTDIMAVIADIPAEAAREMSREDLLDAFKAAAQPDENRRNALKKQHQQSYADSMTLDMVEDTYSARGLSFVDSIERSGMENALLDYHQTMDKSNYLDKVRGERSWKEFYADMEAVEQRTRKARLSRAKAKDHGNRIFNAVDADREEEKRTGIRPNDDDYTHLDEAMFGSREGWEKYKEWKKRSEDKEIDVSFNDFLQGKTHAEYGTNYMPNPGPQVMRSFSGAGWVSSKYTTRNAGFPIPRMPLPEKLIPYCTKISTPSVQAILKFTGPTNEI